MKDDGYYVFKKFGHSRLLLQETSRIVVVPSISRKIDRPCLLICEDDHPSSRSRLEVINEHLATFKALGADSSRRTEPLQVQIFLHVGAWTLRTASKSISQTVTIQQSFDHSLHVYWHLRHRSWASWSRMRLCETSRQGLRAHSLCVPHKKSAETCTWLSLCWAVLKCTAITNLFFDVTVTKHQVE